MRPISLTALLTAAFAGILAAGEEPRAALYLSQGRSFAGEQVTLNVEVAGVRNIQSIDVQTPDGIVLRKMGTSHVTRIVNNRHTQTIVRLYSLSAARSGRFRIGPASIRTDAGTLTTGTAQLVVERNPATGQTEKELYVQLQVQPEGPVYLHQPVLVTWRLVMPQKRVRQYRVDVPWTHNFKGFKSSDPLTLRETTRSGRGPSVVEMQINNRPVLLTDRSAVIGGQRKRILELKRTLVPLEVGEFVLEPSQAAMELILGRKRGGDIFSSLFEDDLVTRWYEDTAPSVKLNVLPLPEQNRPDDFTGAVGSFSLEAKVTPEQCRQGDTVTLLASVEGYGDMDFVPRPQIPPSDDYTILEPEVEVESSAKDEWPPRNRKIFRIPLYISDSGRVSIPSIAFNYFDPWKKEYRTGKAGPFTVNVKPGRPGTVADFGTPSDTGDGDVRETGRDICGIITDLEALSDHSPLLSRPEVMILLVVFAATSIAAGATGRRKRTLQSDPGSVLRHNAWKELKKALEENPGAEDAFRAFRRYVSAISAGSTGFQAPPREAAQAVRSETSSDELARETRELLSHLEHILYRPDAPSREEEVQRIRDLAGRIESSRKKR